MRTQADIQKKLQGKIEEDEDFALGVGEVAQSRWKSAAIMEKDLAMLLQMHKDLNAIVKEPQEKIDYIEQKTLEVTGTTVNANQEITKAEGKQGRCIIL